MANIPTSAPFDLREGVDNVVFAGGGGRCVWQIGFWHEVAPALHLVPTCVAAVSAGAAMSTCLWSGSEDAALRAFSTRMAKNPRNWYPGKLLTPGERAFPQSGIYRAAMLEAVDPAAWERLQEAPPLYILLATPPWWLGARSGALMGMLGYKLEKKLFHPLHPTWGKKLGFVPWVIKAQDCPSREALVDLILQSSCTPPFTPLYRREGLPVLDGGLIDNVPLDALPDAEAHKRTLVLLTRPYPSHMDLSHPTRLYVQPSTPSPLSVWDYTSPEKVQQTYDLGRRDGVEFLRNPPAVRSERYV